MANPQNKPNSHEAGEAYKWLFGRKPTPRASNVYPLAAQGDGIAIAPLRSPEEFSELFEALATMGNGRAPGHQISSSGRIRCAGRTASMQGYEPWVLPYFLEIPDRACRC